jgi:rhomboid protease GluP
MGEARHRERPPHTWITYALIAMNVAMFLVEIASGFDPVAPSAQRMIELGGDFAPLTLGEHQWWRLVSSMFLHYGLVHIGMNMVILFQGRIVEMIYGRAAFAALYLASGLLGSIASLTGSSNVVAAGASGAVFGVFGAFGAYLVMRRGQLDPRFVAIQARSLGTFVAINFAYSLATTGTDTRAHLGGLVAGFVAGAALLVGTRTQKVSAARAAAVGAAAVLATVAGLLALPAP